MLQGFYWDSYADSRWAKLEGQAEELSRYFSLVWIPQSGNCGGRSMGYDPLYYFDQSSAFGSEKQLRSMIATFKAKGIGTIADVVVNHRKTLTNWVDFPAEEYNGERYQMLSTDICANDDEGNTLAWAKANGYSLSANNDTGDGWNGMRDLDHASANVQRCIMAYEDFLLKDMGYVGFRYDVAKGFAPRYFSLYNLHSKPEFSVGEVWDKNSTITTWINGTKRDGVPTSAAFDFPFRYQMRDAINQNNYSKLSGNDALICNTDYRRYAVTFLENHDTEYRSAAEPQDPLKGDTLMANAYLLAMPGTPCVFLTHWKAHKREIKKMIEARRMVGITNTSSFEEKASYSLYYAAEVKGTNGSMIVVVGNGARSYKAPGGYTEILHGDRYYYYVSPACNRSSWEATVNRINTEVFEEKEETVALPSCVKPVEGIYAYFEKPKSWNSNINVWAWINNASHSNLYSGAVWPGTVSRKDITLAGSEDGMDIYLWHYSGATAPDFIIFNDGTRQTADLTFKNGHYYTADGVSYEVTAGIQGITSIKKTSGATYDLMGRRISNPTRGIYIHNGKKIIKP